MTEYEKAVSFVSEREWTNESLSELPNLMVVIPTMLEVYVKEKTAEIIRLQNIGIEFANKIESLKDQLVIASEQVPKEAFIYNNKK